MTNSNKREGERQTERQTDRQTERERKRERGGSERERQRERESSFYMHCVDLDMQVHDKFLAQGMVSQHSS